MIRLSCLSLFLFIWMSSTGGLFFASLITKKQDCKWFIVIVTDSQDVVLKSVFFFSEENNKNIQKLS